MAGPQSGRIMFNCRYLQSYSLIRTYKPFAIYLWCVLQFQLSPELVGVIFLVMAAAYAVSSPIWGWTADKMVRLGDVLISICSKILGN